MMLLVMHGDKCKNGGEIFFVDFAHNKFLLSINDNFPENHPDLCFKVLNSTTKAF